MTDAAHRVFPLDANEGMWRCRGCGESFHSDHGYAICPNDPASLHGHNDAIGSCWYPKLNEFSGNWCVMDVDKTPAEANRPPLANFVSEVIAKYVVRLHNRQIEFERELGKDAFASTVLKWRSDRRVSPEWDFRKYFAPGAPLQLNVELSLEGGRLELRIGERASPLITARFLRYLADDIERVEDGE